MVYNEGMKVVKIVEKVLRENTGGVTAERIAELGDLSGRTVVSRELRGLVDEGKVIAVRQGRNVFYFWLDGGVIIDTDLDLWLAHEDEIWFDLTQNQRVFEQVSENAIGAVQFAFTEMLNNAIDHSRSRAGHIRLEVREGKLCFVVRDYGMGVFRKILKAKGLKDEAEAIQLLMKGKTTTMPSAHSGEGIFWVSKLAEKFVLKSYDYELLVDNIEKDYTIRILEGDEAIEGTEVEFEIDVETTVSLEEFFGNYIGEREYAELEMTVVQLGLYREGAMWVSRSQAKRVLRGLERYQRVVFDFGGIEMVGQGFVDEVFRVFEIAHPEIKMEAINMCPSVELMVTRAMRDQLGRGEKDGQA